ncbi:hypothetical protein F4781DRAFT_62891 [Annulohypoxylon bovei var. microspora]|nr:hypothetical protein F4781DRAFT_62891 [Annulohypoxylon bovei var. microspora]
MAFVAHPVLQLPLHVVAVVLSKLDTIQQLGPVILSHRIFLDSFNDSLHSVARNIIINQISAETSPLAFALLEPTRIKNGDYDAVCDLLTRLETASETKDASSRFLPRLSMSDYNFLSRNYAAAEFLGKSLANEVIPIATDRLALNRLSLEVTPRESCRLNKAFLRYQLMCNLLCSDEDDEELSVDDGNNLRLLFFSKFSPWVNEQLSCIHTYLERKVAEAFDEFVAHDVEYGEMPINWSSDMIECSHVQWFLSQGLPLLSSVVRAKSYSERVHIFHLNNLRVREWKYEPDQQLAFMVPQDSLLEPLGLGSIDASLDSYTEEQLDQLARPSDGAQDSADSSPFRVWQAAHATNSIFDSIQSPRDRNLHECGYVLWDYADISAADLREGCNSVRSEPPHFQQRLRDSWSDEDLLRSQEQRTEIYFSGGTGYWPRNSFDFSGIRGLSEEKKKKLL